MPKENLFKEFLAQDTVMPKEWLSDWITKFIEQQTGHYARLLKFVSGITDDTKLEELQMFLEHMHTIQRRLTRFMISLGLKEEVEQTMNGKINEIKLSHATIEEDALPPNHIFIETLKDISATYLRILARAQHLQGKLTPRPAAEKPASNPPAESPGAATEADGRIGIDSAETVITNTPPATPQRKNPYARKRDKGKTAEFTDDQIAAMLARKSPPSSTNIHDDPGVLTNVDSDTILDDAEVTSDGEDAEGTGAKAARLLRKAKSDTSGETT